jgi:pyruvate/2-oxoglutarate dehydrogenase complex dihydrolipoamide dehydrogenase (E3) component
MPSKALLRSPEVLAAARLAPGAAEAITGELDLARVFWHRDQTVDEWDDSRQAAWLADRNIELVRETGRITAPGIVEAGGRELPYERLVIATGSVPSIPAVAGLEDASYWTSRDATSTNDVPGSLIVMGAGPVGCELAQFFSRAGARVAVVDIADRLLPRDDPEAGALLRDTLEGEGIELRLGATIESAETGTLHLAGGETLESDRLIVATGRRANVEDFGFEHVGVEISKRGVEVDDRLRAADGVWAIGDVNGIAMFTHAGKYQGRIAAADLAGREVRADHRAVPAVTFTDPQVASVGRTAGDGLAVGRWEVNATSRASTYERPKRKGLIKLFADARSHVLFGAVAVGPEAGEWLGQLTLAVRTELPVEVLADTIQPYPTFSEAIGFAARDLLG